MLSKKPDVIKFHYQGNEQLFVKVEGIKKRKNIYKNPADRPHYLSTDYIYEIKLGDIINKQGSKNGKKDRTGLVKT